MRRCTGRGTGWLVSMSGAAVVAAVLAGCASSQRTSEGESETVALAETTPINTVCPVGREAVTDEGGTREYNGYVIAFCCEGCNEFWPSLSESERDEFVETVLAGREGDLVD